MTLFLKKYPIEEDAVHRGLQLTAHGFRWMGAAVFAVLLVFVSAAAAAGGLEALNQGMELKEQKKFAPAADAFDRALEQGGLDTAQQIRAYSNLAFCSRYLRDQDRTIAACDGWIGVDPGNGDAYRLRGMARRGRKEPGKALEDFCIATRLAPDAPQAYYDRATALVDLGEIKLAYTDVCKAASLYGKPNNTYSRLKREIKERLRAEGIEIKQ